MKRQILLSEMNAVGVAGKRDIRAIVDDEAAVVGPDGCARCEPVEGKSLGAMVFMQLNDLRCRQELAQDGLGVVSLGLLGSRIA